MLERILSRTKTLEKTLDAAWMRNDAISQNIANIDTPGYKRKKVAFEEYLNEALENGGIKGFRTDRRHIPIGESNIDDIEATVSEDGSSLDMRLDGNNVDIDNEMASLAKNSIRYNTLIQSLSSEFRRVKSAISEGRR